MEKTYIAVLLKDGKPHYTMGTKTVTMESREKDGNIEISKKVARNACYTQESEWTTSERMQPTEYLSAVMEQISPVLVYTALSTIYAKEATEKIRLLMNECVAIAKSNNYTVYEYMESILEEIDDEREKKQAVNMVYQTKKTHKYRMTKGKDGKNRRIETIPYDTLEKTKFGKICDENVGLAGGCDVYDLIQCANLSILELFHLGMIHKPRDIFECGDYVYKRINALIRVERTQAAKNDSLEYTTADGTVMQITDKQADKMVAKVDRDVAIKAIIDKLVSSADKRTKKEVYRKYLELFFSGYERKHIAKILGVDEKQLYVYKTKTESKLASADMAETLSALLSLVG